MRLTLRCRVLVCHAVDTVSLATWFLFGKLNCVATLFDFGEKRCRKNLPLRDPRFLMSGISDLPTLLASLSPVVSPSVYVFLTRPSAAYGDGADLHPLATFAESEGLTLVVKKERADAAGERYHGEFGLISLGVHSDLQAVGLTAAIANALSEHGISANIVSAFYHDHLFVPLSRVNDAMTVLSELAIDNEP